MPAILVRKKGEFFTHCQSHHRFGPGNGGSVGAIVGGVLGGVAVLVVLGVMLYIMFYRRRKANRAALLPSSEDSTQLGNDTVCFSFYVYYPATEIYLLTSSVEKKQL
jgi:chitin elicitor receptor kinase 1